MAKNPKSTSDAVALLANWPILIDGETVREGERFTAPADQAAALIACGAATEAGEAPAS